MLKLSITLLVYLFFVSLCTVLQGCYSTAYNSRIFLEVSCYFNCFYKPKIPQIGRLAVDWADFFPAWAGLGQFFIPKNRPRLGLGHIAFFKKPAQAKMGQVKSGLGQNGPNFLAVIVPKWADFCHF